MSMEMCIWCNSIVETKCSEDSLESCAKFIFAQEVSHKTKINKIENLVHSNHRELCDIDAKIRVIQVRQDKSLVKDARILFGTLCCFIITWIWLMFLTVR